MTTSRRFRAIVSLVFVNALWGISFPLMRMINALMDRAVPPESGTGSTAAVIVDRLTRASFYMALRFATAMGLLAAVLMSWSWSHWAIGLNPRAPQRIAQQTAASIAGKGWRRPCAERGSGTVAKKAGRETGASAVMVRSFAG